MKLRKGKLRTIALGVAVGLAATAAVATPAFASSVGCSIVFFHCQSSSIPSNSSSHFIDYDVIPAFTQCVNWAVRDTDNSNIVGFQNNVCGEVSGRISGLYGHYRFFVSPRDSLAEVALSGGYELACQPVREEVHYHPAAGHLIVQDPAQRNWGPPLPAGTYHELTSRDVWQTCFEIPPDDAGQVVLFNQNVGGAVATGRK